MKLFRDGLKFLLDPKMILLWVIAGQAILVHAQLDTKHYIPPMYAKSDPGTHYLVLATPVQNTFDVTVKDGAGNLITTVSLSASASQTVQIGNDYASPFLVNSTQLNLPVSVDKGLILSAVEPFFASIRVKVSAQAASLTSKGAKAALGTDFRTGHMFNNSGASDVKSNVISFMATENNTTVEVKDIKPGVIFQGTTSSGAPLTSDNITVTLDAGESYVLAAHVQNTSATNNVNGLNGTHITSDKPIAVNCGSWLGGNAISGTTPGGSATEGRDIGIDQIVSKKEIGDEYVLIKGFGVDNERTIVVASEDNTSIYLNGSATAVATIDAGDYYVVEGTSFSGNNNLYLTSSQPVYVYQMMNGGNGNNDDNERQAGINFLPPVNCTGAKEVTIPNVGFIGTPYINIVANSGASVYVNGAAVTGGSSVNGTSNYVTYQLSGYSGDVEITSSELVRVSLLNVNGHAGAAGFFSGFSKEFNISGAYLNNTNQVNEEIVEGCGIATITIERSSLYADVQNTVLLDVQGTAQEGIDFTNVPDQIVFDVGVTQQSFTIEAIEDALTESDENVIIKMSIQGQICGEDELEFIIEDVQPMQLSVDDANVLCPGDDVSLTAQMSGGAQPYEYNWSTGETTSVITVSPAASSTYHVSVTDVCREDTVNASAVVDVPIYDLDIFTSNDTTVLCPYTPLVLAAEASGGLAPYDYQWFVSGNYILNGPLLSTEPPISTSYIVGVTDQCGLYGEDTIEVDVQTLLMEASINDPTICPYDSTLLAVIVNGGLPPFQYEWNHSNDTTANIFVNPGWTTNYSVSITDQCDTYSTEAASTVTVNKPNANFIVLSNQQMENLPVYFDNLSQGGINWYWDFDNGEFSTAFAPGTTFQNDGVYQVSLIVENELGCMDTSVKEIRIKPEFYFFAPNAFTPNGDQYNNTYKVSVIGAKSFEFYIFNRWGEMIFLSNDSNFEWDGTYQNQYVPDGIYTFQAVVVDENNEKHQFEGHITLLK